MRPPAESGRLARGWGEYRVVLLDARGTGLSMPVEARRPGSAARDVAERLTLYWADAVVRETELVRHAVCCDQPWAALGESRRSTAPPMPA